MHDAINEWLKTTTVHGVGFVLVAGLAGLFVWLSFEIARVIVRTVRRWPEWLEVDMDTKRKIGTSAETITETLGPIATKVPQIHGSVHHLTKAAEAAAARHRDHVGSDVIIHLKNARHAISGTEEVEK